MKKINLAVMALLVTTAFSSLAFAATNDISQRQSLPDGQEMERPAISNTISFEQTNTDTGVILTISSTDPDEVTQIQERAQNKPEDSIENAAIIHTITLVDNGVQIAVDAADPSDTDTIEKIQNHKPGQKGPRGGERQGTPEGVEFSQTNTDTGVIVTVTSDDTDQVSKIQERAQNSEDRAEDNEDIVKSVELLDNGVEITISAADPSDTDTIEKIQNHKPGQKGPRGGERMGNGEGRQHGEPHFHEEDDELEIE